MKICFGGGLSNQGQPRGTAECRNVRDCSRTDSHIEIPEMIGPHTVEHCSQVEADPPSIPASNTGDDPGVEALVEAVQPSGLPARHRLDGPRTMNASPMELRTGTDITKAEIHVMPSIAYLVGRLFFVITLYRRDRKSTRLNSSH